MIHDCLQEMREIIHGLVVFFMMEKMLNDRLDHIKVIFKRSRYFGGEAVKKEKMKKEIKKKKMNKNRRKKIIEEICFLFTQKKMNGGTEEIWNKNKNRRRKMN